MESMTTFQKFATSEHKSKCECLAKEKNSRLLTCLNLNHSFLSKCFEWNIWFLLLKHILIHEHNGANNDMEHNTIFKQSNKLIKGSIC